MRLFLQLGLLLIILGIAPVQAQLRGHGGGVRAIAITPDGRGALSGSVDSSAIFWSLSRNVAEDILRFHESAVNAVVIMPTGRMITGGEDGRIALWAPGGQTPVRVLEGHTAPVTSLAVSPDGKYLASTSLDRSIRLWPLAGGKPLVLEGHQQNVNGVAFVDGKTFVSVSYDLSLRIWTMFGGSPTVVMLPTPLNTVAVTRDRDAEIVIGGADGRVFFVSRDGDILGEVTAGDSQIVSLSISPDSSLVAAAAIRGSVAIVDRKARKLLRTLAGPGLPIWAAAFLPDGRTLLTGGSDGQIRRWDVRTGTHISSIAAKEPNDPLAKYKGDRGAEVYRACIACHTLRGDDSFRAGPTLAGLFGRKIATLPGYNFSPALKRLDITWTPETISKMLELGPVEFTPGTKMPEQKIGSAEDRAALVKFLEKATKN